MKQFDDAISIILAVVIVSTVGFIQEYKSEQAVAALKEFIAHRCVVRRAGEDHEILASELVPGDIVLLAQGARVPADIRIVSCSALRANESILTGEAHDVEKTCSALTEKDGWNLAERKNILWAGINSIFHIIIRFFILFNFFRN